MPTLLHIDASPRGDFSISRKVSAAFVESWKKQHPDGKVTRRDLTTTPLTFVDMDWIAGAFSAPDTHTEASKKALALSDELIAELLAADHIVIGTPMYNLTVPAILKAWIDHIVRFGLTFNLSPAGLEGLAKGRGVTIAIASGSEYGTASPLASLNHETGYLKTILGFIGITDIDIVHAGGTNAVNQGQVDAKTFVAPYEAEAEKLALV